MFVKKFIEEKIFGKKRKEEKPRYGPEPVPVPRLIGDLGDGSETIIDSMRDFSPSSVTDYNRYVQFWKDGYELDNYDKAENKVVISTLPLPYKSTQGKTADGSPANVIPYFLPYNGYSNLITSSDGYQLYNLVEANFPNPAWGIIDTKILDGNILDTSWTNLYKMFFYVDDPDKIPDASTPYFCNRIFPTKNEIRVICKQLFYNQIKECNKSKNRKEDFPYLLFLQKELDILIIDCGFKLGSSSLVQWIQNDTKLGILDRQYPDWYDKLDANQKYFPDYLTFYENSDGTKEDYTLEKMTAVFQSMSTRIINILNAIIHKYQNDKNARTELLKQLGLATRAVNFTRSFDKWYGFQFEPLTNSTKANRTSDNFNSKYYIKFQYRSDEFETDFWNLSNTFYKIKGYDVYDTDNFIFLSIKGPYLTQEDYDANKPYEVIEKYEHKMTKTTETYEYMRGSEPIKRQIEYESCNDCVVERITNSNDEPWMEVIGQNVDKDAFYNDAYVKYVKSEAAIPSMKTQITDVINRITVDGVIYPDRLTREDLINWYENLHMKYEKSYTTTSVSEVKDGQDHFYSAFLYVFHYGAYEWYKDAAANMTDILKRVKYEAIYKSLDAIVTKNPDTGEYTFYPTVTDYTAAGEALRRTPWLVLRAALLNQDSAIRSFKDYDPEYFRTNNIAHYLWSKADPNDSNKTIVEIHTKKATQEDVTCYEIKFNQQNMPHIEDSSQYSLLLKEYTIAIYDLIEKGISREEIKINLKGKTDNIYFLYDDRINICENYLGITTYYVAGTWDYGEEYAIADWQHMNIINDLARKNLEYHDYCDCLEYFWYGQTYTSYFNSITGWNSNTLQGTFDYYVNPRIGRVDKDGAHINTLKIDDFNNYVLRRTSSTATYVPLSLVEDMCSKYRNRLLEAPDVPTDTDNMSETDKTKWKENYKTWVYTNNKVLKEFDAEVHAILLDMQIVDEKKISEESNKIDKQYHVDRYPASEIDNLLSDIGNTVDHGNLSPVLPKVSDPLGVCDIDALMTQWILNNRDTIMTICGNKHDQYDPGNHLVDVNENDPNRDADIKSRLIQNFDSPRITDKIDLIRESNPAYIEGTTNVLQKYIYYKGNYSDYKGNYSETTGVSYSASDHRKKQWGPAYNPEAPEGSIPKDESLPLAKPEYYGGNFTGEYERFHRYVQGLKTADEPEGTTITADMLSSATEEIYESEAIYQVHYAIQKPEETSEMVVGLSFNGSNVAVPLTSSNFMIDFLTQIDNDLVEILSLGTKEHSYTLKDFAAYVKPTIKDPANPTVEERNQLIEYSQMLNTIQGQRDFIQKKGAKQKSFLLKFQQTAKGTFFEVLTNEGDNYNAQETVRGYYISEGYNNGASSSPSDTVIKVPRGRREQRVPVSRGGKTAIPTTTFGKFRITCMPEYYKQEPLDWRNDNYFSNQIYTLNADNLNTEIEPEFAAREKTIFTKDTASTSTTGVKEQEMIGFYTVSVSTQ